MKSQKYLHIALLGFCDISLLTSMLSTADAALAEQIPSYGNGTVVARLARGLHQRGHTITVITRVKNLSSPTVTLNGERIRVVVISTREPARRYMLDFYQRERRLIFAELDKSAADVCHSHWTYEFAWFPRRWRQQSLVTAHDSPVNIAVCERSIYSFFRLLTAYAARFHIQHLFANSPYLAQTLERQWRWPGPIGLLNNLISDSDVTPTPLIDRPKQVICVANSSKHKNVKTLLVAWAKVQAHFPSYKLILIGSGLVEGSPLARMAVKLGVAESVTFCGVLPNAETLLAIRSSRLLVHPSLEESWGLVVMEAMLCGTPVVAGINSGAVPWVVGQNGILVDVRDGNALGDAITTVLGDEIGSVMLSSRSAEVVKGRFDSDLILQQHEMVYSCIATRER